MTQPEPPKLPSPDSREAREALDQLRDTPDREVGQASRRVAGLTAEDEKGIQREHRRRESEAWVNMRVFCIRALGIAVVIIGAIVGIAFLIAGGVWLGEQIKDPVKLDALVRSLLATAGISAVTFVATNVLRPKKDRD